MRLAPYRVRVKRTIEDVVEVTATSPEHAEQEAATVPGVVSVFAKSALRVDEDERIHVRGDE